MNRRSFLTGLIAAPVVVRSGVLMPLRGIVMPRPRPLLLCDGDSWDWTFDVEITAENLGFFMGGEIDDETGTMNFY